MTRANATKSQPGASVSAFLFTWRGKFAGED
jgi:hypothetical protein